jgi:hypothetical protein
VQLCPYLTSFAGAVLSVTVRQFGATTRSAPLLPLSSSTPTACSAMNQLWATSLSVGLRGICSHDKVSDLLPATNSCPTWRGATCPCQPLGVLACCAPMVAKNWPAASSSPRFVSASPSGSSVGYWHRPMTCLATSGCPVPSR